ncbi:MAG: hypothetical protein JNJ88_02820 [Planctomycetes bacterium]|nr:hypothetical protein [Planctomycetota bacterium]
MSCLSRSGLGFLLTAACGFVCAALAAGCTSSGAGKSTSAGQDSERGRAAEEAALRAMEAPVELLAGRVEVLLPAGLYGSDRLFIVAKPGVNYNKREFQTASGHRLSIQKIAGAAEGPAEPARLDLGKWKLYATGAIEVLFTGTADLSTVRMKATAVELWKRGTETRRGVPVLVLEGDRVEVRTTP